MANVPKHNMRIRVVTLPTKSFTCSTMRMYMPSVAPKGKNSNNQAERAVGAEYKNAIEHLVTRRRIARCWHKVRIYAKAGGYLSLYFTAFMERRYTPGNAGYKAAEASVNETAAKRVRTNADSDSQNKKQRRK